MSTPMNRIVVVDVSASMDGSRNSVFGQLKVLRKKMEEANVSNACLIFFDESVRDSEGVTVDDSELKLVPLNQFQLPRQSKFLAIGRGDTALRDAIAAAIALAKRTPGETRIAVITDGQENASTKILSDKDLRLLVDERGDNVQVAFVAFVRTSGVAIMRHFAQEVGLAGNLEIIQIDSEGHGPVHGASSQVGSHEEGTEVAFGAASRYLTEVGPRDPDDPELELDVDLDSDDPSSVK